MRIPAFWYEGDYHPSGVTNGYLLDYNEEGEPVVEPPGGGRETLVLSEYLVLRAKCSDCGDWSQRIDASGTHLVCTNPTAWPPPWA